MAPETTPPTRRNDRVEAPQGANKYMHVLETAWAKKRHRQNVDDDHRRPHYEPAVPPSTGAE